MRKPSKFHINDGICLDFIQSERFLKLKRSHAIILAFLDNPYNFIDILKTYLQSKKNMSSFLSFLKIIPGASLNDLFTVINIDLHLVFQGLKLWPALVNCKFIGIEITLQWNHTILSEIIDFLYKLCLIHLIGKFCEDYRIVTLIIFLNLVA